MADCSVVFSILPENILASDQQVSNCVVHVEVLMQPNSLLSKDKIERCCSELLIKVPWASGDTVIQNFENDVLKKNVLSILITSDSDLGQEQQKLHEGVKLKYHIYYMNSEGAESFQFGPENANSEAATHWTLPNIEFHGLWENLIFDAEIKLQLMNYVSSTLLFSEKRVDANIVPWNKVVLLHGPPGTGKTSLCKALAQKICIRFEHKYAYGHLLEINSHSLFSKWFSESGKLVTKLFQSIQSVIEDSKALVIILIDEVESLAHSRKTAFAGCAEPSDSIRVVNALLTHLDKIKRYPNVLILTTSNITEAIDVALVDRADIKQYIGLPSAHAIYQMFSSCITELQRTGIIYSREKLLKLSELKNLMKSSFQGEGDSSLEYSLSLMKISEQSVGLSGRTVRKLPLMAHALYIKVEVLELREFLSVLEKAVKQQIVDKENVNKMVEDFRKMDVI